jgi:hypothetical protein
MLIFVCHVLGDERMVMCFMNLASHAVIGVFTICLFVDRIK